MSGISEDKLKHTIGVARKCYDLALHKYDLSEDEAKSAFVMGFLHDIGYEFVDDTSKHPEESYKLVKSIDDNMLNAIRSHGNPDVEVCTVWNDILNEADLTTSSKGEDCTMFYRLADICLRYGKDSNEFKNAKRLADKFKEG